MTIIGVTGISGSGKTTVTRMLAQMGGYAVEADPLAHEVMQKGQPAYDEIVAAFGADILDSVGNISRPVLGRLVFDDTQKLKLLERIIHPRVIDKTAALIAQAEASGKYKFAIIDAPLLIEAGMHKVCNAVWLVAANHEVKLSRIMLRDSITKDAAEKRLASRKGEDALIPYASTVIENNGDDLEVLRSQVLRALESTVGF